MTLSTIKPNDRSVADAMFRYGPPTAALVYPVLLIFLHQSGRHLVEATDPVGKLLAGLTVTLTAALVYGVPLLSFAAVLQSANRTTHRLAHLAFAAPPLFTLIGVFFFLVGIANGDYVAWALAWLGVLAYAASASPRKAAHVPAAAWIATAHGISAATILLIFLLWHIGNHVLAVWSLEKHKAAMELLRLWYRSDLVQPIVVALFLWQLISGLRLLWSKLPQAGDIYSSIQTTTAAYHPLAPDRGLSARTMVPRCRHKLCVGVRCTNRIVARCLERTTHSPLFIGRPVPDRPSRGRIENRSPQS